MIRREHSQICTTTPTHLSACFHKSIVSLHSCLHIIFSLGCQISNSLSFSRTPLHCALLAPKFFLLFQIILIKNKYFFQVFCQTTFDSTSTSVAVPFLGSPFQENFSEELSTMLAISNSLVFLKSTFIKFSLCCPTAMLPMASMVLNIMANAQFSLIQEHSLLLDTLPSLGFFTRFSYLIGYSFSVSFASSFHFSHLEGAELHPWFFTFSLTLLVILFSLLALNII